MVRNSGTWRIPPGFCSLVLVTITVIMVCLAAGCMGSSGNTKRNGNSGADNGWSGGGGLGGGSGVPHRMQMCRGMDRSGGGIRGGFF